MNNTAKTLQQKRTDIMIGKSQNRTIPERFRPMLTEFIDRGNELALLCNTPQILVTDMRKKTNVDTYTVPVAAEVHFVAADL